MEGKTNTWEIKSESVQEQVLNCLRQAILNRELLSGERLDEGDLAKRLGVSRGPVREALQQLTAEGLVDHISRVGRLVHMPTIKEVQEVQELRAELESLAACKMVERAKIDDGSTWIQNLEESITQMSISLERNDLPTYFYYSRIFHEALVGFTKMKTLIEFHRLLMNRASLFRQLSGSVPDRQRMALAEHKAIINAIRNKDRELANQLTIEHTMNGTNVIILALQKENKGVEKVKSMSMRKQQRSSNWRVEE
jgi:DNA-binding GntR family transcriptional regulator